MTSGAFRDPDSLPPALRFLAGGGEATRLILDRDWSAHPLGAPADWPDILKSNFSTVLNSPESMILAWGDDDDLSFFFNEAYFPLLGPRLSWAMGAPFRVVWADGWDQAKPIIDDAFAGRSRRFTDQPWKLGTDRGPADTWFTFSYSRILDPQGAIAGLFIFTNETTQRVLADAALRQSEERLRLVIEGARDHVILTTDADGIITTWSAGAEAVLGWSPDEAIGRSAAMIFTEEDRADGADGRELAGAARDGCANDERWHLRKDGTRVFLNGSVHPLPADAQDQPRGFIKIARDETARWQAQRDLQALNATLEQRVAAIGAERNQLWQLSRDPFLICDAEGRWIAASPVWTEILGWSQDELIGRTSEWMEHPDDRATTRGEVADVAGGAVTRAFINRFRTKDGGYRSFSWSAVSEDGRLFCVARDVTDEMERAAALRLYENIVQSDAAPVCAFDTGFRLIAFNTAHSDEFFRIYGYRVKIGDVFPDLFLPEQGAIIRGFMARALTGEVFTVTEEFGDPQLAIPYWEVSYSPLRGPDGRITGAFHHAVDITTRLRTQAALAETQEALRQSQKMEAVGQLTGGLAHDFNNLLTGIMGNLELLQLRLSRGRVEDLGRFILAAQGAGRRAASLTQRLLAFSRRQTLDPRPTDVNRLIAGMEDMLRRTVSPVNEIEIVGAAGLWTANIDAGQLENALLNLCINSRDAMPGGGRITIETANKWLDERAARERDLAPGQYLSLCVTDTGTGMTAETIDRAFEPFFTTKPLGEGTGLGLSMIYGFARQSNGQVRIYSELGTGTTICIYLPRHLGDAAGTEEQDVAAPAHPATGETILVVDDEATIRHLIDEVLDEAGYTVIGAADGAAGLKVLQSGARIELLITDVGLPGGMNGRQVADAARMLRPGLRILFITGYAENAAVGNGHLEPGMELLTKPFTMDALATKVADMMKGT